MNWFEQLSEYLWRSWAFLSTGRVLAVVLGVGFAFLAISLFIASRTRWGRAKPLTKFVVVSVVLHVWLLMYAVGSPKILPQGDTDGSRHGPAERSISLTLDDIGLKEASQLDNQPEPRPWEQPASVEQLPVPEGILDANLQSEEPLELTTLEPMLMPELPPEEPVADISEPEIEVATELAGASLPNPESPVEAEPHESNVREVSSTPSNVRAPESQLPSNQLPEEYRLRQAPNRLQLARAYGADQDSEAAVRAALNWLASAQSADGSWNAAAYGAGTETRALNENRHGTGRQADTGISGLALLAFLSSGHTHLSGEFKDTVRRGLYFLIDAQMPSGDLSGPKQLGRAPGVLNARMYCHGIATLALGEAHAMTLDASLRAPLIKAAQYTINAQDVRGGGWRYVPGDPGDLSQFGWQAMALKSVERARIQIPVQVKGRMQRFLDSCAAGRAGGLATYKPREGYPSDTMTAEALACRLLLDYPLSLQARQEAKSMILKTRPGVGEDNVYFWYYATLALFQLQDDDWRLWNQALKARLLTTQIPSYGSQPGSWEPDRLWGGYGGRVYSTAMSCLCLEVYYRYLPMYRRSNLARTPSSIPPNR